MDGGVVRSYRDLVVWKSSMALAVACYKATSSFPKSEIFGLVSQIRRAATSVPANIAEGNGRENSGSYVQFLRIAQGSLKELETLLMLAEQTEFLAKGDCDDLIERAEETGKMLRSLIRSIQKKI